ncbi:MAG: hypothetical protein ACRCZO_11555, partial [Cetobacterium sp.]
QDPVDETGAATSSPHTYAQAVASPLTQSCGPRRFNTSKYKTSPTLLTLRTSVNPPKQHGVWSFLCRREWWGKRKLTSFLKTTKISPTKFQLPKEQCGVLLRGLPIIPTPKGVETRKIQLEKIYRPISAI